MPVITRLLSFGVSKGLAALLVLALSVIGGVRTGFERTTQDCLDEHPTLVCDSTADDHSSCVFTNYFLTGDAATHNFSSHAYIISSWSEDHLHAPSLLSGSAGGPRAPTI